MLKARGHQVFRAARAKLLIDWTVNGDQRFCHSSTAAAPLSSNHRQR